MPPKRVTLSNSQKYEFCLFDVNNNTLTRKNMLIGLNKNGELEWLKQL